MEEKRHTKIICLSNIFDQHYHDVRGESIDRCLTTPFRRDLFRCLELASGREVIVLSSPPKAADRRNGKWLPAVETRFSTHRQLFCANWDVPKLRIPLSWLFYAFHVMRQVRSGDLVVIDNYEFLYILAARLVQMFRRVTYVLVYLDGKHLIDKSSDRLLSGLAEWAGRSLFRAVLLSNPTLGKRLPSGVPTELVPGFVPKKVEAMMNAPGQVVRFIYSGTLTTAHGIDLLIEAVKLLPNSGWHLTIAGSGNLADQVRQFAQDDKWKGKVEFLQPMSPDAFHKLLQANHVGLNCQRLSHPISDVTFPSKIFTYLSASLLVISSKSGCVEPVCGNACFYYDQETAQALASAMKSVIADYSSIRKRLNPDAVTGKYSFDGSVVRFRRLLTSLGATET